MADLAELDAVRMPLPFTTGRGGYTVAIHNGDIYLNARPLTRREALELSAALARAVNDTNGALR
ncbi:hypothetical protein [Micromonospora sp. NPDC049891]|uniref:hypothetical protein n=1 Tax=Micromonospora sp. NPDC049891 TaxID=3155655 RepID=UPI0033DF1CC4